MNTHPHTHTPYSSFNLEADTLEFLIIWQLGNSPNFRMPQTMSIVVSLNLLSVTP